MKSAGINWLQETAHIWSNAFLDDDKKYMKHWLAREIKAMAIESSSKTLSTRSGEHLEKMEHHHVQWVNPTLFLWPCSIANGKKLPEGNCETLEKQMGYQWDLLSKRTNKNVNTSLVHLLPAERPGKCLNHWSIAKRWLVVEPSPLKNISWSLGIITISQLNGTIILFNRKIIIFNSNIHYKWLFQELCSSHDQSLNLHFPMVFPHGFSYDFPNSRPDATSRLWSSGETWNAPAPAWGPLWHEVCWVINPSVYGYK